jgi:hypothetical protein
MGPASEAKESEGMHADSTHGATPRIAAPANRLRRCWFMGSDSLASRFLSRLVMGASPVFFLNTLYLFKRQRRFDR